MFVQILAHTLVSTLELPEGRGRIGSMKRVAAGAHLSTPWLFEPAKQTWIG